LIAVVAVAVAVAVVVVVVEVVVAVVPAVAALLPLLLPRKFVVLMESRRAVPMDMGNLKERACIL
jgi:hypothetical protein